MGFWGYRTPPPFVGSTYFWRLLPPDKEQRIEYWGWDLLGPITFQYDNYSGLAGDAFPVDFTLFPYQTRLLMATIRDGPAIVQFMYDADNPQPERRFEIGFARLEAARGFRIRNAEPGQVCRYQILPMR